MQSVLPFQSNFARGRGIKIKLSVIYGLWRLFVCTSSRDDFVPTNLPSLIRSTTTCFLALGVSLNFTDFRWFSRRIRTLCGVLLETLLHLGSTLRAS
jgi:hypothetical protein